MAIQEFVGAVVLEVDGEEIECTSFSAKEATGRQPVKTMETYGQFGGALSGAAMGAAAGSVVPLIGNVAGAILGGLMGYFAGGKAGKATGQIIWGDESPPSQGQRPVPDEYAEALQYVQRQAAQPINATFQLNVELDGDKVAAAVETRQLRQSNRH